MKYLLLFIIYFNCAFSQEPQLAGNNKRFIKAIVATSIPSELALLLESVNESELSSDDQAKYKEIIANMDKIIPNVTKKDLFFIAKSEIYKSVLRQYREERLEVQILNKQSLNKLDAIINSSEALELRPFNRWLIRALTKDFEKLVTSSHLHSYLSAKLNNLKIKDRDLLILEKKLTLISPWISRILESDITEFNKLNSSFCFNLLQKIQHYLKLFYFQTKFKDMQVDLSKTDSVMTFFKWEEVKPVSQNSVLDKLDEITDKNEGEDTNNDNWKPKNEPDENQSEASSMLPKNYPTPDANYVPPPKLPEPVNDWIMDM